MCKVIVFSTHYAIGHSFEACRRRNGKIMANFKGLSKDEAPENIHASNKQIKTTGHRGGWPDKKK